MLNNKFYIPEESVDAASFNSKNENSNDDKYDDNLSDKRFTNEHINFNNPNKTASDNEITANSIEHHLPDSITSVEKLSVKSCNYITRLESLKDEFNLNAIYYEYKHNY